MLGDILPSGQFHFERLVRPLPGPLRPTRRKAYLRAIVDRVEVDDQQIRIIGRKELLEQAVLANGVPKAGVRSFVRKWRTRQDLPEPDDSET